MKPAPRPTPHHSHPPIKMRRVADYGACHNVGDFYWKERETGRSISIAIPASGGNWVLATLPIGPKEDGQSRWQWDGKLEAPTLRPSVHTIGIWHGWVRHGFLVEAR